jgi:hypothetical protein
MKSLSILPLACALFLVTAARADPLLTFQLRFEQNLNESTTNSPAGVTFFIAFDDPSIQDVAADAPLFDAMFTAESVGNTYSSTGALDPDFARFASYLTDERDNMFLWGTRVSSLSGNRNASHMSGTFESYLGDGEPTNLAGAQVTSVLLRLDDFQRTTLPTPQTKYTGTVTVTLVGVAVPEPSSMVLVMAGGLLLLRRRL